MSSTDNLLDTGGHLVQTLDRVAAAAIAWDRRLWGGPETADLTEAPCYVTAGLSGEDLVDALTAAAELAGYWRDRIPQLAHLWELTADEIAADLIARVSPTEIF